MYRSTERAAMMRTEPGERVVGPTGVEHRVPGIVDDLLVVDELEHTLAPRLAAPMIDELVAGDGDQPGGRHLDDGPPLHRLHRGEERLRRQVLGQRFTAAAVPQIAEHLGKGVVVEREELGALVAGDGAEIVRAVAHTRSSSRERELRHPSTQIRSQ